MTFHCSGQRDSLSSLQNNIPGEPNVDYPIYTIPPVTGFECNGRVSRICKGRYHDPVAKVIVVIILFPDQWLLCGHSLWLPVFPLLWTQLLGFWEYQVSMNKR